MAGESFIVKGIAGVRLAAGALGLGLSMAAGWARAQAGDIEVERMPFGSGTPSAYHAGGSEAAQQVADGVYHVPNYLPGYPTAATIWPREVASECVQDATTGKQMCSGYRVTPQLGRGEYIFVRPRPAAAPAERSIPAPVSLPVTRKKPLG